MDNKKKQVEAFRKLLQTMDELREQCPWDKKQTNESLRPHTIEETYELADAILSGDPAMIREELGDVLLHIVFYARIGSEKGEFDMEDVCTGIVNKLIRRHPHIYGDITVKDEEEVKQNWEQLKLKEKKNTTTLGGVPTSLPSLVKATRLQEKASGVGFDWENKYQVWEKILEEMEEFRVETQKEPEGSPKIEEEFGDLLFSLVNYARFLKINPDNALEKTNLKFITRFNEMEKMISAEGKRMKDLDIAQLEERWQKAKKKFQK